MDFSQLIFEQFLIRDGIIFTAGILVGLLLGLATLAHFSRRRRRQFVPMGRVFEIKF